MHKDHPLFRQPLPNTIIWRYFKEDHFLDLLENESLHFTKSSELEDPYEGRYPDVYKPVSIGGFNRSPFDRTPFDRKITNFVPKKIKDSIYICSFTINNYESDILWKAYSNSKGAAIQTTVGRLKSCFESVEDEDVFIGEINYMDYKIESFDEGSKLFVPFLHKKMEYKHDDELRAITNKFPIQRMKTGKGVYIPVTLNVLLEKIVLAPFESKDFEESVTSLSKRRELCDIVTHSTLEDKPKW